MPIDLLQRWIIEDPTLKDVALSGSQE
jgi:hypothetical protein